MALKALAKSAPRRVVGLDCSTKSLGYAIIQDKKLVAWGEIDFKGSTVFQRLADGQRKVSAVRYLFDPDLVAIEGAVYIQNKKTVIQLAYTFGAIISAMSGPKTEVIEVSPMVWQNGIGNKALNKAEKEAIKSATPGKTDTWYKNANREFRKERTKEWVKSYWGVDIASDNVTDAVGLASHAAGVLD